MMILRLDKRFITTQVLFLYREQTSSLKFAQFEVKACSKLVTHMRANG